MAWSQADLDAVNAAISSGTRRVRFQSDEVEYRSLDELLRARDAIAAELSGSSRGGILFTEYGSGA